LIRNLLTGGVVGGIVGVLIGVWCWLNGVSGGAELWLIIPFGIAGMLAGGIAGIAGTLVGVVKSAVKEKKAGFWKNVKIVAAREWRGGGVWCHRGIKAGWVAGVFAGLVLNSLLIMYFADSVIDIDAAEVIAGAGCFLILAALYFIGAVGGGVTGIVVGAVAGRVIKEEWVTGFQKALEIFTYTAGGVFITCLYLAAVYGWATLWD